jgi:diacylglycerol kinase (ATP)
MIPLILNPAAGGGRCAAAAPAAVRRLRDAGWDVAVHETAGPGAATALAARFTDEGVSTVLVAGGDGTSFEVLNGVLGQPKPPPRLGLLPLGTGNSFLRDFGVTTAEAALTGVIGGRSHRVDAVRATHDDGTFWFMNLLSLGFTSEVGAFTNRHLKPLGPAGYAVATVVEVARLKHRQFPLRLDGGPTDDRPCVFLSFSNSRYTGGTMCMAPDADPSDGQLDVIRVGPMGRLDLLRTFPRIYQGRHLEHPLNSSTRARVVELDLAGPEALMVDGEVLTHRLRRLEVVPGALEILA